MSPVSFFCRVAYICVLTYLATQSLTLSIQAQSISTIPDQSLPNQNKTVIGHLQNEKHVVTVMTGREGIFYTIHSGEGKLISSNLTLSELIARFPSLGKTVSSGLAGNDARLIETNPAVGVR